MTNTNGKILGIIILATIFGLGSGMVGTLLTRVYILEESFNVPFYGEIDLSGAQYNGTNVVISNPRNVVVEQNTKVAETVVSAKNSIVGIFEKKDSSQTAVIEKKDFDIKDYYLVEDRIAQGLIITSDGWIISNHVPQELKNISLQSEELQVKTKEKVNSSYVVMTRDNKIYEVDNIVIDTLSSHSFWHVSANDFTVKRFVEKEDVSSGQLIVGVDWDGNVVLSSILNVNKDSNELVKSSDDFMERIVLSEELSLEFGQGFFFDLNGDLLALVDASGKIIPIYSYLPCINCLLGEKVVNRPSLGVNYIDLSKLVSIDNRKLKGALVSKDIKGISVIKGSAAELAEIKLGDIIISVNGVMIDEINDLAQVIGHYQVGSEVLIDLVRSEEKITVSVKLGQL